ncbi:MAG: hypothetical protein MJ007_01960 [Paludibacteraceae bacterium]|nr:hypothetical protein [Paludibacteraceae bacterium]
MSEFINAQAQTIAVGDNVVFTDTLVRPCKKVIHREGSGIFTLKGGRYTVIFSANVAGATADTELDLAFSLNGEVLEATRIASTPTIADEFNSVSKAYVIDIPYCCCGTLSIRNIGTTPITVDDAVLVMAREEIA